MSTSSKINESQIETIKLSSKKSFNRTSSPQLTPRSKNEDSSSECSSFDREELLKLQIKQIKRENKFLKKKISDLMAERSGDKPKKKVANKGAEKQHKDVSHSSIDFFFEEINSLINSLTELFKVEFTPDEVQEFSARFPQEDSLLPNKKYTVLKKFTINRKLHKIMLESEDKRYPLLLQTFTTYYKAKEQCDKYIRKVVDHLTAKAHELSKIILDKAQKKSSLKNSGVRSLNTLEDTKIKMESINLPWTFSRIGSAGSDVGDDPHRKRDAFKNIE